MPLYILKRTERASYDEYSAKVIRARNVKEARAIANGKHGDEGQIWTDLIRVKCTQIPHSGVSKEILGSFNAG